ncbi:MAG: thioredoxin family protein [Bacteroidales bacterium]|nr:thioredoxin family protein [Bacteroidales bacterium]
MKLSKTVIFSFLLMLLSAATAWAQPAQHVKWNIKFEKRSATEGVVNFVAEIDNGWHLYATRLPEGGPVPTQVKWTELQGVNLVGELVEETPAHTEIDEIFHLKLGWWTDRAVISQKVQITDDSYTIRGSLRYMACGHGTCQSPQNETFEFVSQPTPVEAKASTEEQEQDAVATSKTATDKSQLSESVDIYSPVNTVSAANDNSETDSSHSLWYVFLGGLLGGFVALLTPCVWPMIPLTVSFFLKRHNSRRRAIVDAVIYGASIVIVYLLLGTIVTLIFGPSMLNELATSAVFNLIFFAMLVLFAVSFFGAFELTLPSSWTNRIDSKAVNTTGILSIFFMAFTLALVSFSCTGPIIGTLLVEAVSLGDLTGPIVGMGAFALALAIPFAVFALFPSWLQGLPKSGGWLNTVKVVLGFIELALSIKFLSVADLAYGWRILDREVFIVLWVVIFGLLGLYLLGRLRLSGDAVVEKIGVVRLFLAGASLSFALYLLPGLWGAPLRAVSAFLPPVSTLDFNLSAQSAHTTFDNYDEGMRVAAREDKPVFLDFSGYGCVNCRKMEMAVLDTEKVDTYLKDNFINITLMVDDRRPLERPMNVTENGKDVELETYGDLWSYLQRHKFGANSQPYYVVLDSKGNLLAGPVYYDENVDNFMKFLQNGLEKYRAEEDK